MSNLYYARWKNGEVDIVYCLPADQKPAWCVEVKWSDLPYSDNRKLKSLCDFLAANDLDEASLVTTKTITGTKNIGDFDIDFLPSALYAYLLGANLQKGKLHRTFVS